MWHLFGVQNIHWSVLHISWGQDPLPHSIYVPGISCMLRDCICHVRQLAHCQPFLLSMRKRLDFLLNFHFHASNSEEEKTDCVWRGRRVEQAEVQHGSGDEAAANQRRRGRRGGGVWHGVRLRENGSGGPAACQRRLHQRHNTLVACRSHYYRWHRRQTHMARGINIYSFFQISKIITSDI